MPRRTRRGSPTTLTTWSGSRSRESTTSNATPGGYKLIQERGYEALTTESHVRYLAPVYFDDRLTIHARCGDIRGARFRYDYVITRDGETVADGWTQHAVVDRRTMRPTRVPDFFAEAVASAEPRTKG